MRKSLVFIVVAMLLSASQWAQAGQRHHRDRYVAVGALVGLALGAAIASDRSDRRHRDDYRYDYRYEDRRYDRRYRYSQGYGYEQPVVRRHVYRSAPAYRYCPPRRYR